ncbi:MAG TPA: FAD:protein FMN transferase [Acidimicrobiales bacterium]|nr:FAD:protein FMN transferase [Acidimicrobiales bacterium]
MTSSRPVRHTFHAFGGARCEIITLDGDADDVAGLVDEVNAFERRLSRFDPRSELSALNTSAGLAFIPSPLLRALLLVALEAYELSDGLVNAGVHDALVDAGYDRTFSALGSDERAVDRVAAAPAPVPPLPLVLDVGPSRVRLAPGYRVDLGGVGKGWLADRLAERFDNTVINLGGDLRARGDGLEQHGWTIGLCDGTTVTVRDAGVATSGTARRHWNDGHHLIDPRIGLPAQTDIDEISVVAASALVAEVTAKTAVILGAEQGERWLRERRVRTAVVAA